MARIQKWETLSSKLIFNNPWCQVRQDEVRLPNGEVVDDYFVNVRPDIVVVLPVTKDNQIVFVRQYRHGVGKILLELPAGTFSQQEDSAKAAARELEEETGYIAAKLTKIAALYDNPVKDTNQIHLFLAQEAELKGKQSLDPTEDIEVVLVPLQKIGTKIKSGEICVSGTVAALFLGLNLFASSSHLGS